jgi:hypothetical protein
MSDQRLHWDLLDTAVEPRIDQPNREAEHLDLVGQTVELDALALSDRADVQDQLYGFDLARKRFDAGPGDPDQKDGHDAEHEPIARHVEDQHHRDQTAQDAEDVQQQCGQTTAELRSRFAFRCLEPTHQCRQVSDPEEHGTEGADGQEKIQSAGLKEALGVCGCFVQNGLALH